MKAAVKSAVKSGMKIVPKVPYVKPPRSHCRPPLPVLLDAMRPVVRQAMLKEFTPDCCIATCNVLRQVFDIFGYDAEAVPTNVYIFNPQMADLLEQGVKFPTDKTARKELLDSTGAWSVGITRKSADVDGEVVGGRFGGHLVLRVMNTLIDASLQQADRPQYGIVLPALLAFSPDQPLEWRWNAFSNRCTAQWQVGCHRRVSWRRPGPHRQERSRYC